MSECKSQLGKTYEDKITGFRGVATGQVRYLTGCNQVLLVPRIKDDGTVAESKWFDEQRLREDVAVSQIILDNDETPGFDAPAPIP
jgi:hypothetical protein